MLFIYCLPTHLLLLGPCRVPVVPPPWAIGQQQLLAGLNEPQGLDVELLTNQPDLTVGLGGNAPVVIQELAQPLAHLQTTPKFSNTVRMHHPL